jgi:ATP-binding cassette, subfamily B, bacterial PglK
MTSKYTRTLRSSLSLFSKKEQNKIFRLILAQFLLTILDLLSVVLIGVIGTLAVNGIKSTLPGERSQKLLELFRLDGFTIQQQVGLLAISATLFLILKTFLSYLINKKILFFLSFRSAALSTELLKKVFNQGLLGLRRLTPQETLYSVTGGVTIVAVGIIGTTTLVISDLFLITTISIGFYYTSNFERELISYQRELHN